MNQLKLEYVDPNVLKPYKNNPRIHPDSMLAKLEKSMSEFGFINPIIALKDNTILAGHARNDTALKNGVNKAPVIYANLSKKKAAAYCIADNKVALESEWNLETLGDLLGELNDGIFDVTMTGFDLDEIQDSKGRYILVRAT